jgi:hypothetical protein
MAMRVPGGLGLIDATSNVTSAGAEALARKDAYIKTTATDRTCADSMSLIAPSKLLSTLPMIPVRSRGSSHQDDRKIVGKRAALAPVPHVIH